MYTSKAQLNSVSLQLQQNLTQYKVVGFINSSTEIMTAMNEAIKLPQIHQTMVTLASEMQKAGIIEEMIDDMMDDTEVEDEANEEIEKVLIEFNLNTEEAMPSLPNKTKVNEKEDVDLDIKIMQEKLNNT